MNKFFKIGELVTWKGEDACPGPGEFGGIIKIEQMNNQEGLWVSWQDKKALAWSPSWQIKNISQAV